MAIKKTIKTVWQIRRDTTENWSLNKDTIPAAGEPCYDLELKTLKIGDGVTNYENLPVIGYSESGDNGALQAEINAIKSSIEALQTDVDNVENNVSDVQEQVGDTNVVEVQQSVSNLTTQIEETNTEIVTIQQTLETKADAETVTELQTIVENKVDTETVATLETELKTYVDEQIKTVEPTNIDDGEI